MASIDLISSSTFTDLWGSGGIQVSASDSNVLPFLITAASDGIQRFLNRWINLRDYTEIRTPLPGQWDKADSDLISLSWFPNVPTPLNPNCTVRTNRQMALGIGNSGNPNVQDAWFQLLTIGDPNFGLPTPCGLTVSAVTNGVQTDATFPFLGTPKSTGFSVVASGSGSSIPAGTYQCAYSNLSVAGESVPSTPVSVTVSAGQQIVAVFPTLIPQASANNFYVSTTNGSSATMTVQNAAPLIQTRYSIAALVSGAAQQTTNYGTLGAIGTAINGLGNGWTAMVQGSNNPNFNVWPSNDVWSSCGTQVGCLASQPNNSPQQGLDVFSVRMQGCQLDQAGGALWLPQGSAQYGTGPGNIWQWPGSTDMLLNGAWGGTVLLKYGAGFAVVPYAIQEACALLVKKMFDEWNTSATLEQEDSDKYKRKAFQQISYLPKSVRQAIMQFKVYEV